MRNQAHAHRSRSWTIGRCGAVSLALALFLPAAIPAAESTREQPVLSGDQLELRNYSGDVTIQQGEGDVLRVFAEHADEESIVVEQRGTTWLVVPASWKKDSGRFSIQLPNVGRVVVSDDDAPPRQVKFRVEVPAWMPVLVESPLGDIEVRDVHAPVEATAMLGNITVTGARGRVRLRTMNGRIDLDDAEGRITVETTIRGVNLRRCGGDIAVETTQGEIDLAGLTASSLEVRTLRGDMTYQGEVPRNARWDLVAAWGHITLRLARPVDARFELSAQAGGIEFEFPTAAPPEDKRVRATLGQGSAQVTARTAGGRIVVGPQ